MEKEQVRFRNTNMGKSSGLDLLRDFFHFIGRNLTKCQTSEESITTHPHDFHIQILVSTDHNSSGFNEEPLFTGLRGSHISIGSSNRDVSILRLGAESLDIRKVYSVQVVETAFEYIGEIEANVRVDHFNGRRTIRFTWLKGSVNENTGKEKSVSSGKHAVTPREAIYSKRDQDQDTSHSKAVKEAKIEKIIKIIEDSFTEHNNKPDAREYWMTCGDEKGFIVGHVSNEVIDLIFGDPEILEMARKRYREVGWDRIVGYPGNLVVIF